VVAYVSVGALLGVMVVLWILHWVKALRKPKGPLEDQPRSEFERPRNEGDLL
jgi:hypothetical protein